ncbi:MAG TPA: OsmC family peroxiredoxin [Candidatus Caenarcaniphilales bacterium]|nr:OsmC family peroxiredoxin [Candidatus Caenarcaniphilales bacterium]
MQATRSATAVWHGDLFGGSGNVTANTSSLFRELPVSWGSRTEEPSGRTSPEELLAAAHAACFSMAMSNGLAKAGHAPDELETRADVTFEKQEAGWRVTRSRITVRGRVPGADEHTFREAAETARDNCPVSQALKGNVDLSVDALLEG